MSIGGVGWWMNVAEEDDGARKMMEQDFYLAEKLFFDRRPVLGRCGSGSKKDVRARKIVVWRRREAKIK